MSCESGKCDFRRNTVGDAFAQEQKVAVGGGAEMKRETEEPVAPEQIEYAHQWEQVELPKLYPPELWAEVRNKTHG